eukprot:TRINITY_DN15741_c0_g1_i1.p2 TRINITY_DN15741_c0_g1~~TRINITY_DN15741_c0_g1_i1.p2  ORF type:complete len:113 (+),score=9.01 TRINITY_DN15741_c0_g1_i1:35-340(+)
MSTSEKSTVNYTSVPNVLFVQKFKPDSNSISVMGLGVICMRMVSSRAKGVLELSQTVQVQCSTKAQLTGAKKVISRSLSSKTLLRVVSLRSLDSSERAAQE